MHAFSPLSFGYLRVAGAAVILNALVPRGLAPLSRAEWRRVAGYSLLGVVINQTLFLGGLALTSAHVAAILMTAIPVFTLGAAISLGKERATGRKIGGIALACAGALTIVAREGLEGASKSLLGDVMLMGNALAYAFYLVLSKRDMKQLSPSRVTARMFALATLFMLPISAVSLFREPWRTIPSGAWLALGVVIVGPTVGAYLLNSWALAHADSSLVAAYTYVQPVVTTILAAIFLQETIGPSAILAAAIIFAGVALCSSAPHPPSAPSPRKRGEG
jgi:drug/metabolite transporter (DMT)-like permease